MAHMRSLSASRPDARTPHRLRASLLVGAMLASSVFVTPAAHAVPALSGGGSFGYVEQAEPITIGTGLQVVGGSFDGEYVEVAVVGATADETLGLLASDTPAVGNGVVSVVGGGVYVGDGSAAVAVGSIDDTRDGRDGQPLRVNFASPFQNSGFEDGVSGWTAYAQRVDLGVTSLAGFVSTDGSTYPGLAPNQDNNAPVSATYNVATTTTGAPPEGSHALELSSSMTTQLGYDVVHGPAVWSDWFDASAGDEIYFDWRAFASADAYHVFGYLVDEAGNQTTVLNSHSTTATSSTEWATKATAITTTSRYRFVFVAGTFDATGGRAAGARLLIDNVRVFGNKVTDAVVTALLEKVTYANSSDDPAATRTIDVTAQSSDQGASSTQVTVTIEPVDDAPTLAQPTTITLNNAADADEAFPPVGGALDANDPDSVLTYAIIDGEGNHVVELAGTYGSLTIDPATGAYTYSPAGGAVNARMTADQETYTVAAIGPDAVTANDVVVTRTLTVDLAIVASAPGAPVLDAPQQARTSAMLTWVPGAWIGGSAVTGHELQVSDDDSETWTDTGLAVGSETEATVADLAYGATYLFRVRASNGSGFGEFSEPVELLMRRPADPVPTPLPNEEGELPAPPPGEGEITIDGRRSTDVRIEGDSNGQQISGDGFTIDVWSATGDGTPTASGVGDIMLIPQGGTTGVSVAGFRPFSLVRLWLFSEPSLIGEFRTDSEGVLDAALSEVVDDLAPCAHTLQAEGELADGRSVAASMSVWVTANPFPFGDVGQDSTHAPGIGCLEWHGYVEGYSADVFDEQGNIARQQAASIVARLLALDTTGTAPFADVTGTHAGAVGALHAAGIVNGVDSERFVPYGDLSRGAAASLLARAAGLTAAGPAPFSDTASNVHGPAIAALWETGVLDGFADGTFRPNDPVTRGQFASLVARALPLFEQS